MSSNSRRWLAAAAGLVLAFAGCDWLFGVDTEPPRCSVEQPADSAIVSGLVQFRAEASDTQGVSRVDFFVDGALLAIDSAPSWSVDWDTRGLVERSWHRLHCVAYDPAGNAGYSDTISVEVVGGGASAVFHGRIDLPTGYFFPVQFSARAGDTLDGGFRLTGGALSRFSWLDAANYELFRAGNPYSAVYERQNSNNDEVRMAVPGDGTYHLVFLNTSGDSISCWARFSLEE